MFPFVADHAMALIELGANDKASQVVGWLEERGRGLQRPWALAVAARSRALLAATEGDFPAALGPVLRGARGTRTPDDAVRAAHALWSWVASAAVTARSGPPGKRWKRRSRYSNISAPALDGKARAELARIGGRRAVLGDDGGRAAGGETRRRRSHQPGDRRHVVHERPDRRGPPFAHLPQARHPVRTELVLFIDEAEEGSAQP